MSCNIKFIFKFKDLVAKQQQTEEDWEQGYAMCSILTRIGWMLLSNQFFDLK